MKKKLYVEKYVYADGVHEDQNDFYTAENINAVVQATRQHRYFGSWETTTETDDKIVFHNSDYMFNNDVKDIIIEKLPFGCTDLTE